MPCGRKQKFYDSSALLLLSLLEEREKTGFQLLSEAEGRSDCAFLIRESHLYPLLHGLEARGDIRSSWKNVDGVNHRFYRLTRQGVRTLTQHRKACNTCRRPIGGGAYVTK